MDCKKSQMSLIIFLLLALLTCFSSSLPGEHPIVVNDFSELVSEESIIEIFRQWRDRHQKVYEHAAESEKRYRNFKRNLKYIIEKTGEKTAALGIGWDWTSLRTWAMRSSRSFICQRWRNPSTKGALQETGGRATCRRVMHLPALIGGRREWSLLSRTKETVVSFVVCSYLHMSFLIPDMRHFPKTNDFTCNCVRKQ